ncbi:polygalacturonase At1g48100-like [Bidens hawaiensis]|uniref:polygalacturonase At1g48100-like n=1 Tax=Bidens hawaiensis TaxID=980011 RepID=UPI0040491746
MRGFSFKNKTFVILTSTLVCLSTFAVCNAATTTKYRRHTGGHHQVHTDKSKPNGGLKFNVLDYGAKGDGKSDDTKAFQAAWANACKAEASMMIVPSGYKFLVGPTSFTGSNCRKNIIFQLDGTILAPTSSKAWYYFDHWLEFTNLEGFTIQGKGTFDGRGSVWWTKQVTVSKVDKRQTSKPTALMFAGGSKVTITGITIQNSPQFHVTFDSCDGVLVHDISISSPGDSPNTDGIHLRDSKNVVIHHTNLACGDDCISIQTGCTNILVHDVNCGPGHGISIGSLGIDGNTACVSNVTVRNINIHGTMTGVRIKTWQGAKGLVRGVSFSNIQVSEVEFPIMIDQYYCDHSICENRTSAISIVDVAYENIKGTYTVQPMHLSCSDSKPCMNLKLSNIELKPKPNGHRMSEPFCWQAFGELNAPIVPELDCLQEGKSSSKWGHHDAKCAA